MKHPSKPRKRFAVCVKNADLPASLELWKIYQVIRDREAESHHLMRVIDESGESYLFPGEYFRLIPLPIKLRRLYRVKAVA